MEKLTCISRAVAHEPPRLAGEIDMVLNVPQPPACRFYQYSQLRGTHYESDLEDDQEYFFVLVTPKDAKSFVNVSNTKRWSVQPRIWSLSPASTSSLATSPSDSTYSPSALLSDEDRANLFCKMSPSQPVLSHRTLTQDIAALGAQLAELNILEIDRWYEAVDTSNVRAVIGIKKGERHLSGEPRKRRRMGFDA